MYDELIKRLRICATEAGACKTCELDSNPSCTDVLMSQAADAIEELAGFLQEAERDRDEYRERLDKANDAVEELSKQHEAQRQNLIALMNDMPRWIPVTERLPEVRTWVLCYCRANSFDVFRMTDEGNWQYGNRSIYMKGYVTHWMPLPPAPGNSLEKNENLRKTPLKKLTKEE